MHADVHDGSRWLCPHVQWVRGCLQREAALRADRDANWLEVYKPQSPSKCLETTYDSASRAMGGVPFKFAVDRLACMMPQSAVAAYGQPRVRETTNIAMKP